jgi:hypothetical protein
MLNQTLRANTAHPQGHKQNPTKTPLFSIYAHRQTIAQGVNGTLAMRFKRRYPAITVKFSHMEVSV